MDNIQGAKMSDVKNDLVDLFSKFATYIIVTALAIVGKIGMDLMNKKKISVWYILGFTVLALFVAVMAYLVCQYKGVNPTLSAVIVGMSAMFSRDIMVVATMLNWKKISSLNWVDVITMLQTKNKEK